MKKFNLSLLSAGCIVFLLTSCTTQPESADPADETISTTPLAGTDGVTAPLLEGIGPLRFPISTNVPLAQAYFNQALTLSFGFNHAEAVRSFKEAARQDATCGICWAGAALALGPNINAPMSDDAVAPAWQAIQKAIALRAFETPKEQAYIDAIATRYSEDGGDRKALDVIYAGSMSGLVEQYPDDLNARTLRAEALMDLMPWTYWNDDGSAASQNTDILVEDLETVMAADRQHPGALHLYIHVMERFEPHRAVAAADRLGGLVPVAGHLVHMPSHIYLRVGRYSDAVDANAEAAEADEDYISQCNAQGLYPAAYYPHNIHFLWYSAMMEGRKTLSISSALKLAERVPLEMARQMGALQSYVAVPVYTYVRFGMWDEVLALPEAPEGLPFSQAMLHYGRGLAHAAQGNVALAQAELDTLTSMATSEPVQSLNMRMPGVNEPLMGIAANLVTARIARAGNDSDMELAALEKAVALQDSLPYTEPPHWHYPVRQTLGEAQLRAGHYADAATTFAQDLEHFPKNPWSLYGSELAQSGLGQPTADVQQKRVHAWRNADIDPAVSW